MWLSAVSAIAIAGGLAPDWQILSLEEARAWQRVRPSIVRFGVTGTEGPIAVCIDSRGYFIGHRSASNLPLVSARMNSGVIVLLSPKATDDVTQLTLWVVNGTPAVNFQPVGPYRESGKLPTKLLAVMGSSAMRAELTGEGRVGIFSEQRRLLPLSEFRFEAPSQSVAGALIFTLNGELAGILNATLPTAENSLSRNALGKSQATDLTPPGSQGLGAGARGGAGGGAPPTIGGFATKQYGPGIMTVAYSTAPNVLQRVIDGFRSPQHRVVYPSLGILCSDAPVAGAEIRTVVSGSPAERAGIRVADILIELAGQKVSNQVDFARIMLEQRIGATMSLKVRRQGQDLPLSAVVGGS